MLSLPTLGYRDPLSGHQYTPANTAGADTAMLCLEITHKEKFLKIKKQDLYKINKNLTGNNKQTTIWFRKPLCRY